VGILCWGGDFHVDLVLLLECGIRSSSRETTAGEGRGRIVAFRRESRSVVRMFGGGGVRMVLRFGPRGTKAEPPTKMTTSRVSDSRYRKGPHGGSGVLVMTNPRPGEGRSVAARWKRSCTLAWRVAFVVDVVRVRASPLDCRARLTASDKAEFNLIQNPRGTIWENARGY
jgi:hypothetical protein